MSAWGGVVSSCVRSVCCESLCAFERTVSTSEVMKRACRADSSAPGSRIPSQPSRMAMRRTLRLRVRETRPNEGQLRQRRPGPAPRDPPLPRCSRATLSVAFMLAVWSAARRRRTCGRPRDEGRGAVRGTRPETEGVALRQVGRPEGRRPSSSRHHQMAFSWVGWTLRRSREC